MLAAQMTQTRRHVHVEDPRGLGILLSDVWTTLGRAVDHHRRLRLGEEARDGRVIREIEPPDVGRRAREAQTNERDVALAALRDDGAPEQARRASHDDGRGHCEGARLTRIEDDEL